MKKIKEKKVKAEDMLKKWLKKNCHKGQMLVCSQDHTHITFEKEQFIFTYSPTKQKKVKEIKGWVLEHHIKNPYKWDTYLMIHKEVSKNGIKNGLYVPITITYSLTPKKK